MTVEKITRIIWWRSITKTLFFLQLVITLFFFYGYLLEFSPHYIVPFLSTNVITANAFVSGRFRSRCRYFVGLRCLRSPERALQNATWKDVWKMRGVKNTYHPLMLLSILPICSERAARKYAFLSGLIINNCHRCMLTHIDWYACGCLLLIFRESALVKHSFYEKLSDNDLLLTNANALLSVQYRYHALSLVSVIWETRTSFAEWYMKGSPKHYGRWKKNISFT